MGNWQLISSEYIKPGKTIANVTEGQKMIKIINPYKKDLLMKFQKKQKE